MKPGHALITRTSLAAVLGALAAAVVTGVAVSTTAANTSVLMAVLEDSALYRVGMPALSADLTDADVVLRMNKGPLRLTREDVDEILRSRFTSRDVGLKAREVHAGLVQYVRSYPADSIFRVSLRNERPILLGAAEQRIVENFRSLPDCGIATDLGILGRAGSWRLFGDGEGEEFLESLPACSPPGPVSRSVIDGVRAEVDRMLVSGPDSAEAFPDPDDVDWATYSRRIGRIQDVDRLLVRSSAHWLGAVGALFLMVATMSRNRASLPGGWLLLSALGVGLLVAGVGLVPDEVAERLLSAFGGEPRGGSETRRLWLDLGAYAVGRVLRAVSDVLLTTGGLLASSGLVGVLLGRRRSDRETPPST